MNTITKDGESYDFNTVDELLATPLLRRFTSEPAYTHFAYNGRMLMAFDSRGPFLRVVGAFKERIMLPLEIKRPIASIKESP